MNVLPFSCKASSDDTKSLSQQRYGEFAQAYTSVTHAKGADLDRLVEIAQPGDTGTPEAIFVNHQIIIAGRKG